MAADSLMYDGPLLISAPGKVILFGEHAVVYKKTAVAASLGLRSYLYLENRTDNIIHLQLPDVGLDRSWHLDDLPQPLPYEDGKDDSHHPLDMPANLKQHLMSLINGDNFEKDSAREHGALAFLYLYISLVTPGTFKGLTVCVKSTLPVGAGLGSSAGFAVVLATALLIHFGHIEVPKTGVTEEKVQERSKEREECLNLVNRWAFKAEQVIHGNPSGVDNAVASYGGAKRYTKGEGFSTLRGFTSLRLLLTNTTVPRSTAVLVAGVGEKCKNHPKVMTPIMDAVQAISDDCTELFANHADGVTSKQEVIERIEELFELNHCLLSAMGVSHPSLEQVRAITSKHGLKTKLTGAGGGGCAVTVIRDDTQHETMESTVKELTAAGFECYETSVGGPGVGVSIVQDDQWNATNVPEFFENELGEFIISRTDALGTFRELGPPDLCHIIKANVKPGVREPSHLRAALGHLGHSQLGSYHYVSGVDASSSATLAAYLNSLTYSLDESQSWFSKSNAWRIRSGIYCCFNAFSRVDVRVEVKIPGGVESYVVDTNGERHEATLAGYRKIDPITSLSAEAKFLEAAENLFWQGWQLGSKPEIQVATSTNNHLTNAIMKYFGDSFRYGPAITLFEKHILLFASYPEVAALLAQSYIGQNEEIKAVNILYEALKLAPMSYSLLHAQIDFLRSKGKYDVALKLAKHAVNNTPSEFLTWAKLTEVYIDLEDYKSALLTLNSCPMFTYSERDMHRMPSPAKTHLPIKPEIISSGVMEDDNVGRDSESDPSLLRLPAPALHGTFAKAYSLLTRLATKVGWDELLRFRSAVFVMEEEYRMQKAQEEKRKTDVNPQAETVKAPSESQPTEDESTAEDTEEKSKQDTTEGDETEDVTDKLEDVTLDESTPNKAIDVALEKPQQAAEEPKDPSADGNAQNGQDYSFSFSNKRLCERWLDNLFMVLYEDLRVYTFWRTEAAHFRAQHMPYRKTGTEWEILGDLALRLWHENEAKEAFEQCLDHKFSAKAWMRLLEIYAKEGNVQKALLAAVKLTVYHERWYHEIVYPTDIACNLNKLIRMEGLSKMQNMLTSMNLPKPVQRLMTRYFDYGELFQVEGYEF
ncbi:unnamed protein product [Umbelopsis vinacea]